METNSFLDLQRNQRVLGQQRQTKAQEMLMEVNFMDKGDKVVIDVGDSVTIQSPLG